MHCPACGSKRIFHVSLFSLAACLCSLWFAAPSFGQQTPPTTATAGEAAKPDVDKAKVIGTRPAEPPAVLQQLNSAIEHGARNPRACDRFGGDRGP
jgi:hypothetical protein